jgi:formate hydrogenlyase subunit 3/multisubunit Na+/H+ antiporter MnhD subunit
LNFLDRYTFLRTSQSLFEALRIVGVLMIVFGGLWTAYQENIKRAFGFSTLTETGFMLLAMGLRDQGGLNLLLMLYPARAIGFWLWGYALSLIETRADSLTFDGLRGFSHRYPIISTGLLISQLSVAGLPLFASFPIKIALLSAGFSSGVLLGSWIFIGNLGLFFFTIRLLLTLVAPDEGHGLKKWEVIEKSRIYLPILLIAVAIIFIGLFPNLALTDITTTLTAFSQLQ